MSRRSQSPEGVGDLLKQDSFGGFEEEEPMNDPQDNDTIMNGADSMYDDVNKEGQSESGDAEMKDEASKGTAGRGSITRIPVPSFKGVSAEAEAGAAVGGAARGTGSRGGPRYFIVKSNNTGNIDHSIKNGIWATQKHNEDKFVEAYKTASQVYLVFSVNMSGHFQGYAKMSGLPFRHQQGTWEGTSSVSNSFNVDWLRRYDLPFRETESLKNPLNDNKPIKISRDGQELPSALGSRVIKMFDEGAEAEGVPRPPPAVRNPGMRAGPATTGFGGGRGMGRGRGDHGGPPQGPGGGLVPTPMGMLPAHVAMQMGIGNPMAMQGIMPGMEGMNPMMMGMPMDPMAMQAMNPMMAARMQMMGGPGMPGMNGMGGPQRGPVPPPKPPPRSPPSRATEEDLMQMMLKLRSGRMSETTRGRSEEEILLRALEMSRGRSPRRDRRYRSRSRSLSPHRGRSRRRSRSRSRSRSRGHGRDRDRDLDLAYEDYLEAFKVMKNKNLAKEGSDASRGMLGGGMNPMLSQLQGMMGDSSGRAGSSSGMSLNNMMKGGSGAGGVNNMSEDEYVRVWENYSKMSGRPFDAQTVRGWYRQHKQYSAMAR